MEMVDLDPKTASKRDKKAPAAKSKKAKASCKRGKGSDGKAKPPSYSVERSRSQCMCRTGLQGAGQSHRIPYGEDEEAKTEKVTKKLVEK